MKRPPNFTYWLDDVPPHGVTLLSALQHIGLVCSFLPIPLAVAREAGMTADRMVERLARWNGRRLSMRRSPRAFLMA